MDTIRIAAAVVGPCAALAAAGMGLAVYGRLGLRQVNGGTHYAGRPGAWLGYFAGILLALAGLAGVVLTAVWALTR